MNMDKNIQEIPIEDIIPNRFQPRLSFNEEGINELSESIKQHGIIQPLVVRKLGDKYEIIAGERRYKAATQAGLTKVPVIVSDIDDNQSAEVALVENIQRRNLTAIEEAKSYKNLLDRGYLTQEQLASKMGVSQSSIANKLRLLNLDEDVQEALLNEKISERHARALLCLEDKEDQKKWLKRILDERMTVRQLDMELKKLNENDGEEDEGIPLVDINPNIDEIVNNAEDINVIREPHDVASMLIPEGGIKEEIPKANPTTPEKMPNKFFNFLEDEEANMSVIEPDEILNTFNAEVAPFSSQEVPGNASEAVEMLDDLDESEPNVLEVDQSNPKEEAIVEETVTENINNNLEMESVPTITPNLNEEISLNTQEEPTLDNIMASPVENNDLSFDSLPPIKTDDEIIGEEEKEISPFKSIFFNTEEPEINNTTSEISPTLNNVIEEVVPVQEEVLVDPLDSIVKLEPDYEARQEELAGTDLKTAINVVRETVEDLNRRGFVVELEEADLEDLYHITIKIIKK